MFGPGEKGFISTQDFLRKIQSLYSLIILPPLGVSTFYFVAQIQEKIGLNSIDDSVKYGVILLVCILIYLAYQKLFSGLKKLRKSEDLTLREKHTLYFKTISSQLGLLSIAAWTVGIAYIVTKDPYFSYLFMFVVLFSSIEWPTKFKIIRHMRLRGEEKDIVLKLLPFKD